MSVTEEILKILVKPKDEVDCIFGFCDNPDFKDSSELKNIQKGKIVLEEGNFSPSLYTNEKEYYFVFMYKSEKPLVGIWDAIGLNWATFRKITKNINDETYTVYISDRKIMTAEDFKLSFSFDNDPMRKLAEAMLKNPEFGKAVCYAMTAEINSIGQE